MTDTLKFYSGAWIAWGIKRLIERFPIAASHALDMAKVLFVQERCLSDLCGLAVYRIDYSFATDEWVICSRYDVPGADPDEDSARERMVMIAKRHGYRVLTNDGVDK